jgi:hypothetical protein
MTETLLTRLTLSLHDRVDCSPVITTARKLLSYIQEAGGRMSQRDLCRKANLPIPALEDSIKYLITADYLRIETRKNKGARTTVAYIST